MTLTEPNVNMLQSGLFAKLVRKEVKLMSAINMTHTPHGKSRVQNDSKSVYAAHEIIVQNAGMLPGRWKLMSEKTVEDGKYT